MNNNNQSTTSGSNRTSWIKNEVAIKEGFQLMVKHLDLSEEPLWPRRIATRVTGKGGVAVYNEQEALARFKAANWMDCSIDTHCLPTFRPKSKYLAPTPLVIDIDKELKFFNNIIEEFELACVNTYNNCIKILGGRPTWINTGGGSHFILPQKAPILELIDKFKGFEDVSQGFLRYEERFLSDDKCDPSHCSSIGFDNSFLRIPHSINSNHVEFDNNNNGKIIHVPPEAEVTIRKLWDGVRPDVEKLLSQYYIYLRFKAAKEVRQQAKAEHKRRKWIKKYGQNNNNKIPWIERLLSTSLYDYRYYCVWRVLIPYMVSIKRLSREDVFNTTMSWLDKCASCRPIGFDAIKKVNDEIDKVIIEGFGPVRQDKLKEENNPFYQQLSKEGVIR